GEVALSWADSFIRDLLTEEEKYQDVIKDLSTDAITATVRQLDRASEEYRTGYDILYNRAVSNTSFALVEVDEEVNEDASETSKDTGEANNEAYDETDWRLWDALNRLNQAQAEASKDVDEKIDRMKEDNEGFWGGIQGWLGEQFSFLDDALAPLAELTSAGLAYLFSIPAETFLRFLADILVPKER
ncbi:unnamed protein product, partial [marine sediment metagenome]